VQYVFLWASGAPNSRAAPGSRHSSYATVYLAITAKLVPKQNNAVSGLWMLTMLLPRRP